MDSVLTVQHSLGFSRAAHVSHLNSLSQDEKRLVITPELHLFSTLRLH